MAKHAVQPFYPITYTHYPVPDGVMPWAPTFSPSGKSILFHDYNGGYEWLMNADGTNVRCITKTLAGRPEFVGGFYYLLDEQRMFLSNELGDEAYILECAPDIENVQSYQWLKIEFSDTFGDKRVVGRRTFHMAPDGKHLAYNILRRDGLIMVLCTLIRETECYRATDYYILNPQGPINADDTSAEGWAHSGSLCEFKSFADGGRAFLYVCNSEGGNIDQYKRDFATGKIHRMTIDGDWDEDGAISYDGVFAICASWRGMHQLDAFSCIPSAPPFLAQNLSAVVAINYVSSFAGFANDLQPWLLSGSGDTKEHAMGQPLAPYCGGDIIVVNNIAGQPMWHPYKNEVLLQERLLTPPSDIMGERVKEKGLAPNRITIAKIHSQPLSPFDVIETTVGDWAIRPDDYSAAVDYPGEHKINGKENGYALLKIEGHLFNANHSVRYFDYSDDGIYYLSGDESIVGTPADLLWSRNFTVKTLQGDCVGSSDIDLHFKRKSPEPSRDIPPMTMQGKAKSKWQGKCFNGYPAFGAKRESFPKAAPLIISIESNTQLFVYVSADINGDLRPIYGATVTYQGQQMQTDKDGKAIFDIIGRGLITASAGDNFQSAQTDFEP